MGGLFSVFSQSNLSPEAENLPSPVRKYIKAAQSIFPPIPECFTQTGNVVVFFPSAIFFFPFNLRSQRLVLGPSVHKASALLSSNAANKEISKQSPSPAGGMWTICSFPCYVVTIFFPYLANEASLRLSSVKAAKGSKMDWRWELGSRQEILPAI